MRAVTWQGKRKVTVENVPDPIIKEPTNAILKVTSTNICGSDLHLYEVLGAFMSPGDILRHEAMGVVEAVGGDTGDLHVGDRVVIPFNISCGHCFMCDHGLQSQCETTQNRADPINMMTLFDKQVNLRMGEANVKRWIPEILPLLTDDDPLGTESFATHRLPLHAAPAAYETFQKKEDGMVKVVLTP